ncbi:uncharacterized protein LOC113493354 isoform X4 [Trichoplusia ni]|uniref:Uncharacterized protein LOC113493354 isoform X4 n=1 Tax=Trichoplusia ni TaxID=7111 RepID=A0A7E5VFN7_TRINI|nr:uncharacterized protein LOC113493354 isoform X4 [Trichoplusia ni]
MGDTVNKDWKQSVGFPINYESASSDDDFDAKDVVFRNPRHSSKYLLADSGDGSEADLLGTTPPRSRIRDKERGRRSHLDSPGIQRVIKEKWDTVDFSAQDQPSLPDRMKKRSSLKLLRSRARDSKQDLGQDVRSDSLPSPNPPAVPTLVSRTVESCNRFMCLTSRPKNRESICPEKVSAQDTESRLWREGEEELPPSRVNFHKTFSLLINMGNIEKGCKRAQISREEQVWQNELKDLIWLELQAKLAGRTLAQQDAFLCAQRNIVPKIIQNVLEYKFVNKNPCRRAYNLSADGSDNKDIDEAEQMYGCLVFDCQLCSDAVGNAMREVGLLLDSFYNAVSLYPSSRNMTIEHPQIATQHFNNRIKAMCLWYNTALPLRMKLAALRRMFRSIRRKAQRRAPPHRTSVDSLLSGESTPSRQCQVRFNVANPSGSNNSDCSAQSADSCKDECREVKDECQDVKDECQDVTDGSNEVKDETNEVKHECHEVKDGQDGEDKEYSESLHESELCCNGMPPASPPAQWGAQDPHASHESGYVSSESGASAVWGPALAVGAFQLGPLDDFTHMRLLDKCEVSLFREHHREILKTQGVRRCMMFIHKMRMNLLDKVYMTLEKPESLPTESLDEDPEEVFEDSKDDLRPEFIQDEEEMKTYELKRYGCWSEECIAMRLPSYRSHFLLLSATCMEAVHDYLSFRLEATPEHPSCLTVKQLIHELREGLDISSEMRAQFALNVRAALMARPAGPAARDLLLLTNTFDNTVRNLLKQYLSYLTTMSETEHMPRPRLQAEWAFTAQLAKRIKCAAVLAPLTFSKITCNQLDRLLQQYETEIKSVVKKKPIDPDKHSIYAVCRNAQSVYAGTRDAALHAAQWARALAARLARAEPPAYLAQRGDIFKSLMSIRDFIYWHITFILERSRAFPSSPEEQVRDLGEVVVTRVRELLLQMFKLGFELHKEIYKYVHVTAPIEELSLRRRPISLQPVRAPVVERRRRPETMVIHESVNPMIHKELHRFAAESPSAGAAPRRSLSSVSSPPPPLPPPRKNRFLRSDSIVDEYENSVFDERLFDNIHNFGDNPTQGSIELLLSGEVPDEAEEVEMRASAGGVSGVSGVSEEERAWAACVARAIIQFARCWMLFVVERCDRGRGLRPRWASQGLEFLMLACDPRNTKHLSDEEFEDLKQLMDGCISHVVGSRATAAAHSPRPRPRLPSPFPSNTSREPAAPPTPPPLEPELLYADTDTTNHRRRVLQATERVDNERDERLRSTRTVGRVLQAALTSYEPKLRQLTFKWQRGLKIGAGTFGKVYTVVNTESGQLLAMKELSVGIGDRRALQRAANELRVLEGVLHPHLVRYYGCELHREEMLIFMELCVEGSLEALVATSGALAEHTARRYTQQLLSAVHELHARGIAHRDIKSGNIFLTNEGHCLKLGDFGCAVKIRANTTAPGELQGFVGTQAYMAPEVFMKTSGHGRAADIWSLGCVVTEMASGKRPFWQYDSNYQIMFLVGSGGRPEIPTTLSDEGQDFCMSCLTHDPDLRPKAETLNLHHFLMVKSDETDCNCEPAYLIT